MIEIDKIDLSQDSFGSTYILNNHKLVTLVAEHEGLYFCLMNGTLMLYDRDGTYALSNSYDYCMRVKSLHFGEKVSEENAILMLFIQKLILQAKSANERLSNVEKKLEVFKEALKDLLN